MPLTTRPTSLSFGLKTLGASVACAMLMLSDANAAGLGKLTVLSSLGQPLRAEIELTSVGADEANALVAKLASADAFRQVNIDFNPALLSLRFAVDTRGARQFIKVSSTQPINEPFVDMLLELTWNGGRLVREYTFLLDPAELRNNQPVQVAAPFDVPALAKPAPQPGAAASAVAEALSGEVGKAGKRGKGSKPVKIKPESESKPEPKSDTPPAPKAEEKPEPKPAGEAGSYEVKRGDTLGRIAGQLKGSGVSLDQMLVALYRANESAFIDKNMNRLRSGQILQVPDAEQVKAMAPGEAHNVVLAHSNDFNSYRNKLAGAVATGEPTKVVEPKQSTGSGKITSKVEERSTPANAASDKLKLSNSLAGAGSASAKTGKTASAEDKIAKDKASAENAARVKELEKNVAELKRLADLKNKNLAEQEKKAADAKAAQDAKAAKQAKLDADLKAQADAKAASKLAADKAAADKLAADKAAKDQAAASASVTPAPVATPAATPAPIAAMASATSTPTPKPRRVIPTPPPPPPEPSIIDSLMGTGPLAGLAALLALVGGYVFYKKRKKPEQRFDTSSSMLGDSSMQANSMFGSTGGQSVDTNNSVFNSNFAPSASQLDTNEVDPVAEADVYIAYGRDVQAEEILKEALRTQPERNAVRLKLLEIYANRKDTRAFEVQATELYSITHGDGDDWAQAASMGVSIDPNNPLYAGADAHDQTVSIAAPLHSATEPMAELDPDALLVSTQQPAEKAAHQEADLDLDLSQGAGEEEFDFNLDEINQAPAAPVAAPEPAPAPAPVAPPAPAAEEEHILDFDLGGLTFEPTPTAGKAEAKPAAPESFAPAIEPLPDLGLSLPPAAAEPEHASLASEDFDLQLDLPASATEPEMTAAAVPLETESFDFDSMDFGLPTEAAGSPEHAPEHHLPTDSDTSLDDFFAAPKLDLADEDQTLIAPAPAPAAAQEFDLSGIDLDLGTGEPVAHIEQEKMDAFAVGDDPSADQVEMDTKLDLAIAYQEIGDKEGARELIDEVIKGGTPEQIEKAKAMRAKLA
jgi:pilus assembly protein FimV